MFANRADAARQLAEKLMAIELIDPLVLAIPRGGVITGAVLARELGADLDVVLSRKLRAPFQPELAIGAVGEDGKVYLNRRHEKEVAIDPEYLERERKHQVAEIARRQKLFRAVCPRAPIVGRSVILTDDGIATGSTMIAGLHVVKSKGPHETIVAVPVAPPERLEAIRQLCDRTVCLLTPPDFYAIGQFYLDFEPVEDVEVVRLLRDFAPAIRQGK